MGHTPRHPSLFLAPLLAFCLLVPGVPPAPGSELPQPGADEAGASLVRVNIVFETRGAGNAVEINGQLVTNYSPVIVHDFPTTGIVLDHENHIMTFLGYRWVDLHEANARVIVTGTRGQKWNGRLIGIDQSNGVAVVKLLEGRLGKTPVCVDCEFKNGVVVTAPIPDNPGDSEFREAQIVSVGTRPASLDPGARVMQMSRPFPGIGLPILTRDHRVIGFVAGLDPRDMQTVVYPLPQMLSSAEKILKAGGDIRAGWLGVFLGNTASPDGGGVAVERVVPGSPAQAAGLRPGDLVRGVAGHEIRSALQFIQIVQNTPVGTRVKLDVVRQGRLLENTTALIESRKPAQKTGRLSFNLTGALDAAAAGIVPELKPRNPGLLMGLSTEILTPPLADALHVPGQTGLLVLEVTPGMPAATAGIFPGDIIVSIDGQPILDAPGFTSFLLTHPWGSQSVLKVLRKGSERTILVQIAGQPR